MFTCCDDPKPMLQEQSNRFFCNNCRKWLEPSGVNEPGEGTALEQADADAVGNVAKESQ